MSEQPPVDLDALHELKEVMEDQFGVLVETYLQDSETRLEQLAAAVEGADADALRAAAHSFKGSCANLGIAPLAEICYEAEAMGRDGTTEGSAAVLERIRAEYARVKTVLEGEL